MDLDLFWQDATDDDLEDITNALFLEIDEESEAKYESLRPGQSTNLGKKHESFDAQLLENYFRNILRAFLKYLSGDTVLLIILGHPV